jgi:hypothetical protein
MVLMSGCDSEFGKWRKATALPGLDASCVPAGLASLPNLGPVSHIERHPLQLPSGKVEQWDTFGFASAEADCSASVKKDVHGTNTLTLRCGRLNRSFSETDCQRMDAFLIKTYDAIRTTCPQLPATSEPWSIRCSAGR